jgi:cytochrome c6
MLWHISRCMLLFAVSAGILTGCSRNDPQMTAAAPAGSAVVSPPSGRNGEALFKQYCAACHPDGGNVSDPERTLRGSVLKRNHITTPDDLVRVMRTPRSRMIRFDVTTLSDGDALAIAEYVLKTFK